MNEKLLRRIIRGVPQQVRDFMRSFQRSGFEIYLVGGAVRNLVLGHLPSDFDFATNATPDAVRSAFPKVIPTGIQHGTVTVIFRGEHYEVTTYRTEGPYTDRRRPDHVEFVGDIHADLSRRDFTMNAMALDPVGTLFLDPHDGEQDIHDRVIRAIGEATERFEEDPLRMLRAVRFASQLGFRVDDPTLLAIRKLATRLSTVSAERIRDELSRIMQSDAPSVGIHLLRGSALLPAILPELAEGIGVEQRGNHRYDVYDHSVRAADAARRDNLIVRLAALLHDIGKPRSLVVDGDQRTFHGHDALSASMSEGILKRLKYPNAVIAEVTHLVRNHMFHYTPDWTDAAVRRFIARVGMDSIENLVELRIADSHAVAGRPADERALDALLDRVARQIDAQAALTLKDLAIGGNDLMAAGVPRGPLIGVVLDHLLEAVIDDPTQNTAARLTEIATRFYQSRLSP